MELWKRNVPDNMELEIKPEGEMEICKGAYNAVPAFVVSGTEPLTISLIPKPR